MSLRKRIIMNAGSNWVGMIVNAAIGFFLVRIIWRNLGPDGFGVWALLSTGLRYPMIFENAFSLSTNRFVAFYRNDSSQMNRFISASFIILSGLAVLTVLVIALLSFFVSRIFTAIPNELASEAKVTCILVGITLALKMIEATFSGTLRGYQRDTRVNFVMITSNTFRAILTVLLLLAWKSIIAVQLAFMISAATSLLLMIIVCRISIEGIKISFSNIEKNVIRELFKYSGHAVGRSGSMIFMYTTLSLLIGRVGTARDIAVYEVGMRISGLLRSLLAGAQNVFLPVITSLFAAGHIEKMKAVIRKSTHLSCVMTFVPLILLFIYAREILVLWLKDDIFPEMILVLRVLIISEASRGFFGIWIPSLVGMGHLRWLTIAAITTAVLAITMELILFQSSILIPLAAAVALVVALWVYMGFWLPVYGLYKTKISPLEYFKSSLLGPFLAAVISITVLWILNHIITGIHWLLMFATSGIIVLIIFVAISLRCEAAELLVILKKRFSKDRKETI